MESFQIFRSDSYTSSYSVVKIGQSWKAPFLGHMVIRKLSTSNELDHGHPWAFGVCADARGAAIHFHPSHCVLVGYAPDTAVFRLLRDTVDVDCAVVEDLTHLTYTTWT